MPSRQKIFLHILLANNVVLTCYVEIKLHNNITFPGNHKFNMNIVVIVKKKIDKHDNDFHWPVPTSMKFDLLPENLLIKFDH